MNNLNVEGDVIDLKEFLKVIWSRKLFIFTFTGFFSFIALLFSLTLPNIYQSNALLSPVESQGGMSSSMRSYSGLASLAGINLPAQSGTSTVVKATKKISSLSFFSEYIMPKIFLPDLMALDSWDSQSNAITYDLNKYDPITNNWIRSVSYPQSIVPSTQESYEVFVKKHLNISQDEETGFISISIKHQSPFVAQEWTELIVSQVNNFFREKDRKESERALNYLNSQIAITGFSEIKQVIADLVKQQTEILTLIEVSDFYVFEYIDPPVVMENTNEPNRKSMLLIGAFIGLILGLGITLFQQYFYSKTNSK
tara:strand:- start:5348 stop:6280 length:933 start_codon:yes stop_codon:yes gene_type:complete